MSSSPSTIDQHSLNLLGVLSETKRILSAHSRHFLALSVIFLLPLSFSVAIFPFLFEPSTSIPSNQYLFFFSTPDLPDKTELLNQLIYGLFILLFSLFASASITYSTFHGFYGRPVKIVSSLKSVLFTFFPLLATLISVQFVILLLSFAFGGFAFLAFNGIALFGVEMDYDSIPFLVFAALISGLFVCLVLYFQIEWHLVHVVVVVESKWGLGALKRSSYLMQGMKSVVFVMLVLFGVLIGVLSMLCSILIPNVNESSSGWASWSFGFQTVVYVGCMTLLMLYCVAANAVLFMYCKALHGELALDIAEEFSREYVSLPFDDGKVPHVVYVV